MKFLMSLVFSFLLIFTGSVYASDYAADLFLSTSSVEMGPCGTTQIIGILKNLGAKDDSYAITSSSDWVTIAPENLNIKAGEQETVYLYITPSCYATPGQYEIEIQTKSSKTSDKDTIALSLLSVHNVELSGETEKISCFRDAAVFMINVSNKGKVEETFDISAANGVLSESQVAIPSGELKEITLTVAPSEMQETINVAVKSASSYAMDSLELSLNGMDCYDAELEISPLIEKACVSDTEKFAVSLKNTGIKTDKFDLSTTHGLLSNAIVTLEPNETGKSPLSVFFEEKGTYKITVTAVSAHMELEKTFDVSTSECHSAEILVSPKDQDACACDNAFIDVTVKNTGKRADSYKLEYEDVSKDVSLEAGDSASFNVNIPVSCDSAESKNISFRLSSASIEKEDTAEIKVKTVETCYGFELETENKTLEKKEGFEGEGFLLTLNVTNTGEESETYSVSFEGPSWVYVDPDVLDVKSGETREVYVYMSPGYGTEKGVYETKVTVENSKGLSEETTLKLVLGNVSLEKEERVAPEVIVEEDAGERKGMPGLLKAAIIAAIVILAIIFKPELGEKISKTKKKSKKKEKTPAVEKKNKKAKKKKAKKEKTRAEDIRDILDNI